MSPSARPATQNEGGCRQVPRVPRKTKVYVTKCQACHVKRRHMSPSATPATQSAAASPATNPVEARHQSQPSTLSATPDTQNEGGCRQVPRLPRKTKVYVTITKCHACHVKRRHMSPSARPATQSAAASPATNLVQARHQSQPSALRAMPATQNEGGCRQVPCLPRKVPWRHRRLIRSKRATGASPVP